MKSNYKTLGIQAGLLGFPWFQLTTDHNNGEGKYDYYYFYFAISYKPTFFLFLFIFFKGEGLMYLFKATHKESDQVPCI